MTAKHFVGPCVVFSFIAFDAILPTFSSTRLCIFLEEKNPHKLFGLSLYATERLWFSNNQDLSILTPYFQDITFACNNVTYTQA